jgi:uncharacterized membrane protein
LARRGISQSDNPALVQWDDTLVARYTVTRKETGFHNIKITLPNIDCPTCTLQVAQWADEFNWYYYSCSDIRITADASISTNIESNCTQRIFDGTCDTFEPAEMLVRIGILETIYWGSFGVFTVALVLILAGVIFYAKKNDKAKGSERNLKEILLHYKWLVVALVTINLAAIISSLVTFAGLKSCSMLSAYDTFAK